MEGRNLSCLYMLIYSDPERYLHCIWGNCISNIAIYQLLWSTKYTFILYIFYLDTYPWVNTTTLWQCCEHVVHDVLITYFCEFPGTLWQCRSITLHSCNIVTTSIYNFVPITFQKRWEFMNVAWMLDRNFWTLPKCIR